MTKKYRILYWLFFILSLLANVGPLAYYTIDAAINSDLTYEKLTLTTTVILVLIMSIVCLINKTVLRSRIWIILIGLYVCLDFMLTPLMIIACCQIADELVLTPLKKNFREKLIINKQFDKRMKA